MEFVDYFLKHTDHPMWVSSIANTKGSSPERHVASRDAAKLKAYVETKDVSGTSVYFCASTIADKKPRKKSHAREVFFLWVDIDFRELDLTEPEVFQRLKELDKPPSRIHFTGNGYHALWMLRSRVDLTQDGAADEVERLLRMLQTNLAGDPMVCQVVSLLRMPGTHNSKSGAWSLVEVPYQTTATYSLRELDEWLSSLSAPAMLKRGAEDNPWLRAAAAQGYKAPIDVEERLAGMVHKGVGDNGVHTTQVSVTASLMSTGNNVDDATAVVLEATKKAAPDGWNWAKEEAKIRELCKSFVRKHPEVEEGGEASFPRLAFDNPKGEDRKDRKGAEVEDGMEEVTDGNVVKLADKRTERKPKLKKQDVHIALGAGVILDAQRSGEKVLFHAGRMFKYSSGVWRGFTQDEEKTWVAVKVEEGCRQMRVASNAKIVNETRAWLQRNPDLQDDGVEWDAHAKIPTKSGLIDPVTWKVRPSEADDYVTMMIDCEYDPRAKCPVWEEMLADAFDGHEATIKFIQEVVGASLVTVKPRSLMRALVLLGASNSGKSNLLNVMAGLVSRHVNSTPLQTLENAHGLVNFLSPHPWVLHEAFEQAKWEMSSTTKSLLSGDPVTINVKNGALISHRWRGAVFWGTNVPPQFKEASRAMENRLAIVNVKRVYDHTRTIGAALKARDKGYSSPADLVLSTEKEGVLVWALKGLRSALDRGHFELTEEMSESLHAMRMAANIASGFMEECVEFDHSKMVSAPDFYGAFSAWWRENRGGIIPSVDSLGRSMASLSDPRVAIGLKHEHVRQYAGLKLTEAGLDYWNAHAQSTFSERSGMRIAASDAEVNQEIPGSWSRQEAIVRMRRT